MNRAAVEIRPEVAIYAAFSRLNYRPWYALAEFVDNALQSFLANRPALESADGSPATLKISILLSDDRIEIHDNAAGISGPDFPRAFLPASPPPDTSGLSEFGLGMKAAACWFAKRWTVRTSALGEPIERRVEYDIPEITGNHIDRLPVIERDARANAHYTIITLEQLNVRPRSSTIAKIKRHLSSIYRMFLQDRSLVLQVGTESLVYEPPTFLVAPRYDTPGEEPMEWRKEFSLELDDGHRIFGWAGILSRASVANAGLAVFRRRRLIEGSYGEAYRPELLFRKSNSYTYQRLVGELNVEGFTVSHTKDGVQWAEWEDDLLEWLRVDLDKEPIPLLRQAENYRARPQRPVESLELAATDAERVVAQHVPPLVADQLQQPAMETPLPSNLSPAAARATREAVFAIAHLGTRWRVVIEIISDESSYEWLQIAGDERLHDEHRLHIRMNAAHPFMVRFSTPSGSELTAFTRIAAGLAIAEATARATGVRQAGTIRRNLNQLMHDALAAPAEQITTAEEGDS